MSRRLLAFVFAITLMFATSACSGSSTQVEGPAPTTSQSIIEIEDVVAGTEDDEDDELVVEPSIATIPAGPSYVQPERSGQPRPDWLGTLELPLRPGEDNAIAQPTPPELIDRQLWTTDVLAPPPDDTFVGFVVSPPPDDVVARSTWRPDCPVGLEDLSYATVSFYGFDGWYHTGEFILHNDFATAVFEIFEHLHASKFPIEEMVVTTQEAVDAAPTGDSNNTSSFVCRPSVNSTTWSRHAHGGAIDINPFHNPYAKGDLVIPELATAYLDRDRDVPGMITPEITSLFAELGWGWGGDWNSASDWMHFSDTGN